MWRICEEDPEAIAYIDSSIRFRKDYERAKRFILDDPLNQRQDRKRPRMTKKAWRDLGLVYKYRIPSGEWRFFYLIDPATECVELLWAGPHKDADKLG